MAVVMNELNRTEEAIEAIKSSRHLCPRDSRESIDYMLIELYKGMADREIKMLEWKLVEGTQGEQEKASILGKLGSAYMRSHNYGIAEQHYRKALAIQPDMDWRCNLVICLIYMNKISEAQALLTSREPMDDSHINRLRESAKQMLSGFEFISSVDVIEDTRGSLPTLTTTDLQTVPLTIEVPGRWSDLVGFEEVNNALARGLPEAGAEPSTEEDD